MIIGRMTAIAVCWHLLMRFAATALVASILNLAAAAAFTNQFLVAASVTAACRKRNTDHRLDHRCNDQRKDDGNADWSEVLHLNTR